MHLAMAHSPAVPPPWLLRDPKVSQGAKLLYVVLADSEDAVTQPGELADRLAVKRRTIDRYLAELRECGAIGTKSHGRAGGVSVEISPKLATKERTPEMASMPEVATKAAETSPELAEKAEISPKLATNRGAESEPKSSDSCTFTSDSRGTNPPINPPQPKRRKPASRTGPTRWDDDFERFYAAYPRRYGSPEKAEGREVFIRLMEEGEPADALIAGAVRYAECARLNGDWGTKYVKQIPTYLNKRGWEEDLGEPAPAAVPALNGHSPPRQQHPEYRRGEPVVSFEDEAAQTLAAWEAKYGDR